MGLNEERALPPSPSPDCPLGMGQMVANPGDGESSGFYFHLLPLGTQPLGESLPICKVGVIIMATP